MIQMHFIFLMIIFKFVSSESVVSIQLPTTNFYTEEKISQNLKTEPNIHDQQIIGIQQKQVGNLIQKNQYSSEKPTFDRYIQYVNGPATIETVRNYV